MKSPVAVAAVSLLALSGCAAFTDDSVGLDNGVQVAAAFYPLQYVAGRVAGEHAEVTNLASAQGEPHDLELTPQETAEVAQSDLVVYEHGFQPAVDEAVDTNAAGVTLDVADVVEVRPADPHFWQDPLLMAELGDAVAAELGEIDPAHAADYRANAAELRTDLETLDAAYADGLARCDRHTVVVSHAAFGYLDRYGLEFEPIAGLSPDSEPTPADLAHLQEVIEDDGITTVFYESLVSPEIAEQLAADTGAQVAVLDPVEGLTDDTADEDYLSLMEANLAALEEANGC
ncbi:zinc ABC transporter solute-binding protein [Nocardioides sp. MAH-18]|uniref:Zinc ABC transporter solute-binding protein n=1 Tax=Nocardioides agri TaxID=2682843 RepID=A0A6L6XK01_9ACTN|nr:MULTISPECIES: metal ABC transporter substrate-binding protein [unclassified Nocardioides]MBA2956464.1 zinc ABC transporter substrate-binding protein [Nocardioides sp. CGMCC 1.13656]MVQ47611.1 zinc ABC transporter solute-binding protein [Nocardioides sp. MAH-18]